MREDSLILKYRKAMKQKSNATIEEKNNAYESEKNTPYCCHGSTLCHRHHGTVNNGRRQVHAYGPRPHGSRHKTRYG